MHNFGIFWYVIGLLYHLPELSALEFEICDYCMIKMF